MAKAKSLSLKYIAIGPTWEVVALTNIAEINPGDHINRQYMAKFVADPDCTVDIVAPDYLSWLRNLPIPFLARAPAIGREPPQ